MNTTPVLVVGAGPVGLTTALALSSYGVACTVVEATPRHVCEGSRSICVQKHTLELAERIGAGRTMADEGVSWKLGRTYYGNTELFQIRLGETAPGRFPPFVNLPQWRVEEILLAAVEPKPEIDLRWSHRLDALEQDPDGVTAHIAGPSRPVALRAAYVVGCDGGQSRVRDLVGVDFPGATHPDRFLIADIRADLPFPNERRFYFDPPFNPGRQVLVHPQPDRVWRIDWQVPATVDVEEERRSGRLDDRIRAVIGEAPYEIVWVSQYTFAQRLASRFRAGRVFLAGDAAHLMSVFGARGMNSGMQDACNLAWKLWLVAQDRTPDALLDSYEAERRAAARENLRVTEATMRFMVPPTRAHRALRNVVLRGSLHARWLRRFVNSGKLSEPFVYRHSPIVQPVPDGQADLGALPGAVAPDATAAGPGGTRVRVLDLIGPHVTALYLARDGAAAQAFAAETGSTISSVPTRVVTVAPAGRPGPDRLIDDRGEIARVYGPPTGRLYVLRPDTHVAARVESATGDAVAPLVERATGGQGFRQ